MAQKKTTNLLPRKFRTSANTKFLNSVVEPLISEPELRRIDGYVGQHLTRSYRVGDGYIQEDSATRQHYQFEPTLIVKDVATDKTKLTVGYTELIDKLRYLGSTVTNESLLFEQPYYNYHGNFDIDKFVNYAQYYWVSGRLPPVIIEDTNTINIATDILSKSTYTSANNVVFTNGLLIKFRTLTEPADYQNQIYYVEGVGSGIKLVNISSLITPEPFITYIATPYDIFAYDFDGYDTNLNDPQYPEYFVINRADQSLSAWTRCNRWMHIDVLRAFETYQNIQIDLSKYARATRPIIEFNANIALFNHGVNFYGIVDLIDTTTTDPLSDANYTGVNNSTIAKLIDTIPVQNSYRIIFTAALDPDVKNKIYTARIGNFGSDGAARISLTATTTPLLDNSSLLVKQGANKGRTFVYRNGAWRLAQQKTRVNQPPLFDLFDTDGNSYSDTAYYPASTFAGTPLFSYKPGTGNTDPALDIALSYRNIGNIGDIQFEDFITTSTFSYLGTGSMSTKAGQIKIAGDLSSNWLPIVQNSFQRQIFEFVVTNTNPYIIDIVPKNQKQSIEINVNGRFLNRDEFTYNTVTRAISFVTDLNVDDFVSVLVRSDQVSSTAYFELPLNLINNSDNQDISTVTLGQLRNHFVSQYRNYLGANNSFPGTLSVRDFPASSRVEGTILQHSSPVAPAMFFLTSSDFDFVASVEQARTAYSFFKKRFLDAVSTLGDLDFDDIPAAVDTALDYINQNKSPDMPYYYSDMVPTGSEVSKTTYTVLNTAQESYGIESIFDSTVPSGRAVLVYCNNVQLVRGRDYDFDTARPGIKMLTTLPYNSILEIRDYASTDGCYIPETPTKMGLWPSVIPEITVDYSFRNEQTVIVGHDGSRTIVFGDMRDNMVLELELRIYNNIKRQFDTAKLDLREIVPGAFRSTGFTLDQIDEVLAPYYYRWKDENNLNIESASFFKNSDAWTWNYYNQLAKDNSRLTGSWSTVFRYWYDTAEPSTRPWEMLGYSSKPSWWNGKYGPAPYTAGNTILWDDIRDGVQTDTDGTTHINPLFARPNIYSYLPVDGQGQLRTPLDIFVKVFNGAITNTVYTFGMGDPVENSWRRSSDYPFASQIAMAVLKPAKYFAQFAS